MGRSRRMWNPNIYEHVVMRGNNRQTLFHDREDVAKFFDILRYTHEKYPFTIISYCLMSNHYHLLIRSPEVPHSNIMAIINKRYSDHFKKKYGFSATIYESRFYSKKVLTAQSLLAVSRYIHRNPIETTPPMVNNMEFYPYSSYHNYMEEQPSRYGFLDFSQLHPLLAPPYERTKDGYKLFCEQEDSSVPDTLVSGTKVSGTQPEPSQ